MKKFLSIILSMVLVFSTLTFVNIPASAYTDGYFTYSVSNGEAEITNCDSSISGAVTIPSTLGGYPVTSIGDEAFEYCSSLTSITIPNSITSIGYEAFVGCDSLTKVNITDVKAWCEIYFGDNPLSYAGVKLYLNNQIVTNLTIPDGLTKISAWAFSYCDNLISITIPDSVTSIERAAFEYCKNLTNVTIGNNVASIAWEAFVGCSSLANVIIPDSVTNIGEDAFAGCDSLTSVSIGNGVTSIGEQAFYNCSSLTNLTIPDNVTSVGKDAFYNCYSLTSVIIGNGIVSIGEDAFAGCYSLTSVHITDIGKWCEINFNSVNSNPLFNAKNLYLNNQLVTNLIIPDSVTSIGPCAFFNCTSITSVSLSNNLQMISVVAFGGCTSLTNIIIPKNVVFIEDYAIGCFLDYDYYDDEYYFNIIDDFIIYGYTNTAAERYAIDNNIAFVDLDTNPMPDPTTKPTPPTVPSVCVHTTVVKNVKKATYFGVGYTGDTVCSKCGVVTAKGKSIAKLTLKTPKFKLVKGKKLFKVKYTKVAGATGFQVRYKIKGKWKTKIFNTKKTATKAIRKLKKDTYQVQIRAMVKSGSKKAYSAWSKTQKVKVK